MSWHLHMCNATNQADILHNKSYVTVGTLTLCDKMQTAQELTRPRQSYLASEVVNARALDCGCVVVVC